MSEVRTTHRWRGVVAVALVAAAAGTLLRRPSLLLVGAAGAVLAAYPRLPPTPEVALELDRTLAESSPDHGESVDVEVTVRNVGDRTLPDLRIIDGVPPMLSVSDGTPRHVTALRPGASATFSYSVTAKHGTHLFDPATVVARDVSGAREVETTVENETAIDCSTAVPSVPLRRQTQQYVGEIVTEEGGVGTEFHGSREYRRGDSPSRIDWKRFARTAELTTVEYHEERVASVVVCVDAREPCYRASDDAEPHAVSYGVAAAEQLVSSLVDSPNYVGLAALGREFCWLPPSGTSAQGPRARRLMATHRTFSTAPPTADASDGESENQVAELRKHLGTDAQVVLVTPLLDDLAAKAAMAVEASGHSVTVVSPDVTATETVGNELARFERRRRITTLRESDLETVDWKPDEPLGVTLVEATEARSR